MSKRNALLFFLFLIHAMGCTRSIDKKSTVIVRAPKALSTAAVGQVDCYAVNVVGAGITSEQNACSPLIGQHSNFVPAGGKIEFEVTSGSQRNIQLFVYKASAGEACPNWSPEFNSPTNSKANFSKTFKVDNKVLDLPPGVVSVTLTAKPTGNPLIAEAPSCSGQGVRAKLYSSGGILNATDQTFIPDHSKPTNLAMTKPDEDSLSGDAISFVGGGLFADIEGLQVQLPPYLHGLSQKPDTREFFAMLVNGRVVKLDPVSGTLTDLNGSCPLDSCQVPLWMESFSVGFGSKIFGKDHSGQIWEITGPGQVTITPHAVKANVSQVVYF